MTQTLAVQTKEAMAHALASGCPIVVALTKCDMPGAQPARVRRELMAEGLELEEAGGDIQVSCGMWQWFRQLAMFVSVWSHSGVGCRKGSVSVSKLQQWPLSAMHMHVLNCTLTMPCTLHMQRLSSKGKPFGHERGTRQCRSVRLPLPARPAGRPCLLLIDEC